MADAESQTPEEDVVDATGPENLATFRFEQLKMFTNNFNKEDLIKRGANPVFKGTLENGNLVAIKRYKISKRDQWEPEVEYLPTFSNSDYIVKLLGKAATNKFLYLVYPWVDKGDLDHLIISELDWERIKKILRGVLRAMSELHSSHLMYRDMKAGNVLIDQDWNPVLADFGTVGEASKEILGGTFGHTDHRAWNGKACEKTDMYGVGILMLQLIMKIRDVDVMGKCPFEAIGDTSAKHIIGWAYEFLRRNMSPAHAYPNMTTAEADWITCLGLECVVDSLESRPTVGMLLDRLDDCPDHEAVRKRLEKLVEEHSKVPPPSQAEIQSESGSESGTGSGSSFDSSAKAKKKMGRKWIQYCMACVKPPKCQ